MPVTRGRACGILTLAVLLFAAAACDGKEHRATPGPARSSTPSASASTDPETAAARSKAIAAYNGFREAQVAAAATSDPTGGDLAKYTADPLLTQLRSDLELKRDQSLITVGRPTWKAEVTVVNVTTRPFTATVQDCFDGTNWTTVNKTSSKPAGVAGQAKKYIVDATVVQYDDGRWLVTKAQANRERSC
jgi:hypothetical protein